MVSRGVVVCESDGLLYDVFGQIGRLCLRSHDHADARVPCRTGEDDLLFGGYTHSVIEERNVARRLIGVTTAEMVA